VGEDLVHVVGGDGHHQGIDDQPLRSDIPDLGRSSYLPAGLPPI
jgi:hypothetical protein